MNQEILFPCFEVNLEQNQLIIKRFYLNNLEIYKELMFLIQFTPLTEISIAMDNHQLLSINIMDYDECYELSLYKTNYKYLKEQKYFMTFNNRKFKLPFEIGNNIINNLKSEIEKLNYDPNKQKKVYGPPSLFY